MTRGPGTKHRNTGTRDMDQETWKARQGKKTDASGENGAQETEHTGPREQNTEEDRRQKNQTLRRLLPLLGCRFCLGDELNESS